MKSLKTDSPQSLDQHVKAYEGNSIYDFDNEILLNWYPQRIRCLAVHARSLLELGLGHGFSTTQFADAFPRHVVVEGSPAVIKQFKKAHPRCPAQIIEELFENFIPTESFDVIVMGFVLEHVDDPVYILRKFADFLSDKGKIFVAVPNAEVLNRRLGKLMGLIEDIAKPSENDLLLGHRRYYTITTLHRDLEQAGLRVGKTEGIYLKPLSTQQILSLNLDRAALNALCEVGIGYPELSCGMLVEASRE